MMGNAGFISSTVVSLKYLIHVAWQRGGLGNSSRSPGEAGILSWGLVAADRHLKDQQTRRQHRQEQDASETVQTVISC